MVQALYHSFIVFVLLLGLINCHDPEKVVPVAKKGVIDLSQFPFAKQGSVSLDGEWEFYWNQTWNDLQVDQNLGNSSPFLYQTIPASWKGFDWFGKPLEGFGYATFKLKMYLPEESPLLSLHNLDLSSAYRLYLNGKLIHEVGSFSNSPYHFSPLYKSSIIDLEPISGEVELVYEIANFHYSKGGFWESVQIGERSFIHDRVNRIYQITAFLAGSILLWALYHLGLYFMRKDDRASLFLSLFCIFLVLRLLTTGERILTKVFPGMSMDAFIRLEFSTAYVAALVLAMFYRQVFPEIIGKKTVWIVFASLSPFIFSLVGPVHFFSKLAIYYQVVLILICIRVISAIVFAFKYEKIKSGLSLIGFLFIFTSVINDILYQNNIINTMNLTPFGFLGFILFQGYILSYEFTKAYKSVEKLKENLEISNQELNVLKEGLEDIVVERTKELEVSKENIERLNTFSKTLNESLDSKSILKKAFEYLSVEVLCDSLILFLVDEKQNSILYHESILAESFDDSLKEKLKQTFFPLTEESGLFYQIYNRKKPFRFSRVWENRLTESNQNFVKLFGQNPGMILPLISQGKTVAMLLLFSSRSGIHFTKNQLQLVESTAESLATAVTNSILVEEMNRERQIAELSRLQMENAKNEVVKLNEFSKKINSETSLGKIIEDMFEYIQKSFGIEATILQLVDFKKNEFYTYSATYLDGSTQAQYDYALNLRLPLNSSGGILYKTFLRKKPLYIPERPKRFQYPFDEEIFTNLNLSSFVAVPLVVQNQVIAMAYFTSYQKKLDISREELKRIAGFCDQIAGAIQNSVLLSITEEERKKSERAKSEILKLNEFAKNINSINNLENILAEIFGFIRKNYKIEHCVLYFLDKEFSELRYLNHSGFDRLSEENILFFKSLRFPLNESGGFVYQCYKRKKHFYMKKAPNSIPYEIDSQIIQKSEMNGFLISPLINNDEVVAMAIYGIEDKSVVLKNEEVQSIVGVSEHIASAINNHFLMQTIEEEKNRSNKLLLNILPKNVAEELQKKGRVNPVEFENVTLLMTSFPGFSQITSQLTPEELIEGLDLYFSRFDEIIKVLGLEKLRMTGDMYLCAGGLPVGNFTHPIDACLAALKIRDEVSKLNENFSDLPFKPKEINIAIHSGPVVAGVIGKSKFNYDVWGKTVTQTQAIRRGGQTHSINISSETMEKVKRLFIVDNARETQTYEGDKFSIYELKGLKEDLSGIDGEPNEKFQKLYTQQKRGARILMK